MFTAVILVCVEQACFAVGGPVTASVEACRADVRQYGARYVRSILPEAVILDWQCIPWGKAT